MRKSYFTNAAETYSLNSWLMKYWPIKIKFSWASLFSKNETPVSNAYFKNFVEYRRNALKVLPTDLYLSSFRNYSSYRSYFDSLNARLAQKTFVSQFLKSWASTNFAWIWYEPPARDRSVLLPLQNRQQVKF